MFTWFVIIDGRENVNDLRFNYYCLSVARQNSNLQVYDLLIFIQTMEKCRQNWSISWTDNPFIIHQNNKDYELRPWRHLLQDYSMSILKYCQSARFTYLRRLMCHSSDCVQAVIAPLCRFATMPFRCRSSSRAFICSTFSPACANIGSSYQPKMKGRMRFN